MIVTSGVTRSMARKVETVIIISLTDREDADSVRRYDILPQNGKCEKLYLKWEYDRG